nr:hypothetical protein [Marinicella sp. W31]MDC2877821.1 hypothetical protein [Marinicella sp. W31]
MAARGVRVRGQVRAHVVQSCVVTLEPIETDIDEAVDVTYLPDGSRQFRRKLNEEGSFLLILRAPMIPNPSVEPRLISLPW